MGELLMQWVTTLVLMSCIPVSVPESWWRVLHSIEEAEERTNGGETGCDDGEGHFEPGFVRRIQLTFS